MSEEFQKHMFDSFSQEHAQAASTGTGLGLAIVKSLVKLMNGQIKVNSELDKGTTVMIHIETDVCQEQTDAPTELHVVELKGKRVLLCEDNEINIFFVKHLFEKWELETDVAENGRIGVELFAASAPGTYDAIIMDVMMPEMNGLEATRIIRQMERPDAAKVPIIAMTANAYDTDVKNCMDAGMNEHMSKPIDPALFRALLSKVLS